MSQWSLYGTNPPGPKCVSCAESGAICGITGLLDLSIDVKCDQCSLLRRPCNFSEMDKSLFLPYVSRPQPKLPKVPLDISDVPLPSLLVEQFARAVPLPALGSGASGDQRVLRPEVFAHLLESHLRSYFKSHGSFDWSRPLDVYYEFLRPQTAEESTTESSTFLGLHHSLDAILFQEQIIALLDIFVSRFLPWLNISLTKDSDTDVLEMVLCSIASPYLNPPLHPSVSSRLQKLIDATITNLVCKAPASLEVVQALLILALWPTIGSEESGTRDGRALIVTAISIALNLRLNEASANLLELRKSGASETQATDLTNKARLWSALVSAESMLCLGSGRDTLASRGSSDIDFIPPSTLSPETRTECRDARLRFLGEMFGAVESARQLRLSGPSDLDDWYDANMKVLGIMDCLHRLILPLEVVADYDQFFFHMLMIVLHSCRLQIVYHAIYIARKVFTSLGHGSPSWFMAARPHGLNILNVWGRDALSLSATIICALLQTDPMQLSSCPDIIFSILAFAADVTCAIKSFLPYIQHPELRLSRSTIDKALKRVAGHLQASATSDVHPAAACARFIWTMLHAADNIATQAFSTTQDAERRNFLPKANDHVTQGPGFGTQLFGL